ncbi:MAG: hypothetical protein M3247_09270, partial [Thermoproteota archaeon]|nr:hypothetical protein [Thermoproteota archaeon]
KVDFIDHQLTDQTSIIQFIKDNWNLDASEINPSMKKLARLQICLILQGIESWQISSFWIL